MKRKNVEQQKNIKQGNIIGGTVSSRSGNELALHARENEGNPRKSAPISTV